MKRFQKWKRFISVSIYVDASKSASHAYEHKVYFIYIKLAAEYCPDDADYRLMKNESTTHDEMKANGWQFKINSMGDWFISANFTGTGTVTINYASMEHGARVYHNSDSVSFIKWADYGYNDKTVYFDFSPNDKVVIKGYKRNPVIADLKINCQGTLSAFLMCIDLK